MNIHELTLKNYRCFEEKTFRFAERFNLLIGDNGSGKTAILDGLAIALASSLSFDKDTGVPAQIGEKDVRYVDSVQGETYTREQKFPSEVSSQGIAFGGASFWTKDVRLVSGPVHRPDEREHSFTSVIKRIQGGDSDVVLPVVAYYNAQRRWKHFDPQLADTVPPGSRTLGYRGCLDPVTGEKTLHLWFKTLELQALQEGQNIGILESARQAILECIESSRRIWFNIRKNELLLRFPDREVPFRELSDGYRNMLAMVADIAMRCATLNPALMNDATKETPGVVLIDEIDLHLHPKWQRRVVGDLMRAFPKVQFIATTHSPFIIQSLPPQDGVQLINLDNPQATDFANKSVEDIAEKVQDVDVPQRSQRFLDMMKTAEEYYSILGQAKQSTPEELHRLKVLLDELMLRFSDDPAYHALLKMERVASGIDGGNHSEAD